LTFYDILYLCNQKSLEKVAEQNKKSLEKRARRNISKNGKFCWHREQHIINH
jgi:hypothetical protein